MIDTLTLKASRLTSSFQLGTLAYTSDFRFTGSTREATQPLHISASFAFVVRAGSDDLTEQDRDRELQVATELNLRTCQTRESAASFRPSVPQAFAYSVHIQKRQISRVRDERGDQQQFITAGPHCDQQMIIWARW